MLRKCSDLSVQVLVGVLVPLRLPVSVLALVPVLVGLPRTPTSSRTTCTSTRKSEKFDWRLVLRLVPILSATGSAMSLKLSACTSTTRISASRCQYLRRACVRVLVS